MVSIRAPSARQILQSVARAGLLPDVMHYRSPGACVLGPWELRRCFDSIKIQALVPAPFAGDAIRLALWAVSLLLNNLNYFTARYYEIP